VTDAVSSALTINYTLKGTMIIDPSTPVGKIRLRVGDWHDLPILPDAVIASALEDCGNSIPRSAALCAQYILGILTAKTHKKLAQVEIWGDEYFDNYVKFLKLTVLNPHLMQTSPVPYVNTNTPNPLIEFQEKWNKCYGVADDRF